MKECSRKQSLKNSKIEFLNYNKLLNLVSDLGCNNDYQITVAYIMFHCKIAEPELKGNL